MSTANDRIALNEQSLTGHLDTMSGYAKALNELRKQAVGLTFGHNGARTSTGPDACRMVELTEQLADTIEQMGKVITGSVKHLKDIREDITTADSIGGES